MKGCSKEWPLLFCDVDCDATNGKVKSQVKHCPSCGRDDPDPLNQFCTQCGLPLPVGADTEAETLRSYEAEPLHGFPQLELTLQPQAGEKRTVKAGEWVGTRRKHRGIEGFSLHFNPPRSDLSLRYMGHFHLTGDTGWATEGTFLTAPHSGNPTDDPRLLQGFAIELTGDKASEFSICYEAHLQDWEDTRECCDGNFCGTRKLRLRVEAMRVRLFPKLVVKVEG